MSSPVNDQAFGNEDPRDLLEMNPESVWLNVMVAVKSMLANFEDWESKDETDIGNVGDFIKRISDWHKHITCPWALRYTMTNLPPYAKSVIVSNQDKDNIFELHASLLLAVSEILVECVTEKGVGPNTMEEIGKWFELMEEFDVERADAFTQQMFSQKIDEFEQATVSTISVREYPFFKHNLLFIHIAYMVYFTCVYHVEYFSTDQYITMNIDEASITNWEASTAKTLNERFDFSRDGLCWNNPRHHSSKFIIDLPYEWFIAEIESRGVPPVTALHTKLMYAMYGIIQDTMCVSYTGSGEDNAMLAQFEVYMTETSTVIKQRDICLKKREKVRRNYRNNMNDEAEHKPREPNYFDRADMFLFGKKSYYHLCCTDTGVQLRENKKQLKRMRVQY